MQLQCLENQKLKQWVTGRKTDISITSMKKIDDIGFLWLYHRVLRPLIIHTVFMSALALLVSLVLVPIGFSTTVAAFDDSIRVAIVKNESSVSVEGDGLIAATEDGAPVVLKSPSIIKPVRDGISVQGTASRLLTIAAASHLVINGKPYRGRIDIRLHDKGLLVVNELPLEEYIAGLINAEISSAWPIEAVKAQAVIARTYALNRKEARKNALYHLESSVIDQVYGGSEIEDSRALRAVSETAGQILTHSGSIIQAFYHSNCGGKTESAENVWGAHLSYMTGVDCQYCLTNPSTLWELKLSLKEIEDKTRSAGHKLGTLTDIRTGVRNGRGRLTNVMLVSSKGTVTISGDQFRKIVGYGVIKSTNFMVKISSGNVHFSGYGNGHGVGLCQWGAKQRAVDGFSYTEILSYYYPGTELKKLSELLQ